MRLARHHWEILHSRVMRETKSVPDDQVGVFDILFSVDPGSDTLSFTVRLVGVFSARVELLVLVFSHVDVVIAKLGSLGIVS